MYGTDLDALRSVYVTRSKANWSGRVASSCHCHFLPNLSACAPLQLGGGGQIEGRRTFAITLPDSHYPKDERFTS